MGTVIVVQGPTGVGKSSVAIALAQHYHCSIISCDSRQFYHQMTIGTAVPSNDELAAAKHYFIQDRSVETPLSAGAYEIEALAVLENIFKTDHFAILVGGSGLYVDALINGLDPLPSSEQIRSELNTIYAQQGLEPILEALHIADPIHYNLVDRSNPARVIRALEVCRASGMPYSNLRTARQATRPFRVVKFAIDTPRAELYERINHRVDMMIDRGLEYEARTVIDFRDLAPLKTVGYSEFFDYFDGNLSFDQTIDKIKQNTRNYAKRQLTWLRRERDLRYFATADIEAIIKYIDGNN